MVPILLNMHSIQCLIPLLINRTHIFYVFWIMSYILLAIGLKFLLLHLYYNHLTWCIFRYLSYRFTCEKKHMKEQLQNLICRICRMESLHNCNTIYCTFKSFIHKKKWIRRWFKFNVLFFHISCRFHRTAL